MTPERLAEIEQEIDSQGECTLEGGEMRQFIADFKEALLEAESAYKLFPPLLRGVCDALKGIPAPSRLMMHDWSDLPVVAKRVMVERRRFQKQASQYKRERDRAEREVAYEAQFKNERAQENAELRLNLDSTWDERRKFQKRINYYKRKSEKLEERLHWHKKMGDI